ncbi:MAG: DUF1624 domain-containing protein [Salinarimonadaceae bacterium]|nr:MAG: DUF1624 domain-containing protein [Salinarimonadaceae bacterium]
MSEGASPRIAIVDVARGGALVAMIVYHFAWDLSFLGFVRTDVGSDPAWRAFAMSIAGSFLFITGFGLVLAHDAGQSWTGWLRRIGKIGLAAALVTVATYAAFPDGFVYFGILHMIAAGAVLALPFLRAPPALTAGVAAIVLVTPHFVSSSAFDSRWLAWTGFAQTPPATVDFEPVFPWFAPVLLGVAAARLALDGGWRPRLASWRSEAAPARLLDAMGRRSLLVYLAHQPILLAVLYPLSLALPVSTAGFVAACTVNCAASGTDRALCESACICVAERAPDEGLGRLLVESDATPDEQSRLAEIGNQCLRDVLTPDPVAPNE